MAAFSSTQPDRSRPPAQIANRPSFWAYRPSVVAWVRYGARTPFGVGTTVASTPSETRSTRPAEWNVVSAWTSRVSQSASAGAVSVHLTVVPAPASSTGTAGGPSGTAVHPAGGRRAVRTCVTRVVAMTVVVT